MNDDWDSFDWEMNAFSPVDDADEQHSSHEEIEPYNGGDTVEPETSEDREAKRLTACQELDKSWQRLKLLKSTEPKKYDSRINLFLMKAAHLGFTKLCVELIEAGANPNSQARYALDDDPLSIAFNENHLTTSLILVCLGAKLTSEVPGDQLSDDLKNAFLYAEKFSAIVKRR